MFRLVATLALTALVSAHAQEQARPLSALAGTWEVTTRLWEPHVPDPVTSGGEVTNAPILGGEFVQLSMPFTRLRAESHAVFGLEEIELLGVVGCGSSAGSLTLFSSSKQVVGATPVVARAQTPTSFKGAGTEVTLTWLDADRYRLEIWTFSDAGERTKRAEVFAKRKAG